MSLRQLIHDVCRNWACVFCLKRAKRRIYLSEISVLKQHAFPAYDPDCVRFSNGVCTRCSEILYRRQQWGFTRKILHSTKLTQRINKAHCNGRICCSLKCKRVRLIDVKSQVQMVSAQCRQWTWRADAPTLSNALNLAWAAKPLSAATPGLGTSVCLLPTKHHRWKSIGAAGSTRPGWMPTHLQVSRQRTTCCRVSPFNDTSGTAVAICGGTSNWSPISGHQVRIH